MPTGSAASPLHNEINDNSVAILLTYGTARILLAGDAEANEEEYMANGPYTGPLTIINVEKLHTRYEPRFCVLLAEGGAELFGSTKA